MKSSISKKSISVKSKLSKKQEMVDNEYIDDEFGSPAASIKSSIVQSEKSNKNLKVKPGKPVRRDSSISVGPLEDDRISHKVFEGNDK